MRDYSLDFIGKNAKIVYGVYFIKPDGDSKPINNFRFIYAG
jgi:hypothetical protein